MPDLRRTAWKSPVGLWRRYLHRQVHPLVHLHTVLCYSGPPDLLPCRCLSWQFDKIFTVVHICARPPVRLCAQPRIRSTRRSCPSPRPRASECSTCSRATGPSWAHWASPPTARVRALARWTAPSRSLEPAPLLCHDRSRVVGVVGGSDGCCCPTDEFRRKFRVLPFAVMTDGRWFWAEGGSGVGRGAGRQGVGNLLRWYRGAGLLLLARWRLCGGGGRLGPGAALRPHDGSGMFRCLIIIPILRTIGCAFPLFINCPFFDPSTHAIYTLMQDTHTIRFPSFRCRAEFFACSRENRSVPNLMLCALACARVWFLHVCARARVTALTARVHSRAVGGQVVFSFGTHAGRVNTVSFAPNGKFVASGSTDGVCKVRGTVSVAFHRTMHRPVLAPCACRVRGQPFIRLVYDSPMQGVQMKNVSKITERPNALRGRGRYGEFGRRQQPSPSLGTTGPTW